MRFWYFQVSGCKAEGASRNAEEVHHVEGGVVGACEDRVNGAEGKRHVCWVGGGEVDHRAVCIGQLCCIGTEEEGAGEGFGPVAAYKDAAGCAGAIGEGRYYLGG